MEHKCIYCGKSDDLSDPILDPSQGIEYCQSNIDIKFGSYDAKKSAM